MTMPPLSHDWDARISRTAGWLPPPEPHSSGIRGHGKGVWQYLPNAASFQAGGGPLERLLLTS